MQKLFSQLALVSLLALGSTTVFAQETTPATVATPTAVTATTNKDAESESSHQWKEHWQHHPENAMIPIAFFIFLMTVILGSRAIRARSERSRIELIKLMVEKGQPVSEKMMQNIFDGSNPWGRGRSGRRGYSAALIGVGLLTYAFVWSGAEENHGVLIAGIILLGIGLGNIIGGHFDRRDLPPPKQKPNE